MPRGFPVYKLGWDMGLKNTEFIYKNCVFILTCLNFSHLQILSIWCSAPVLKRFLNLLILMPFSASAIFLFHLSTSAKCFPLRTYFNWEWIGRVGHEGSCYFWSKTAEHSAWCGRCAHKSPIVKWANTLSLQKKFTEAKHSLSQQRQLVHWYTWVPRTLT